MTPLNRTTVSKPVRPERIVQFGEGNFLRGFVEWMVQRMNRLTDFNSSVVIVKPRPGNGLERLQSQDCLYHVNIQGLSEGVSVDSMELIDCVSRAINPYTDHATYLSLAAQPDIRFVVSNTTEAGIVFEPECRLADMPPSSYPAKLTQMLYHRFRAFRGDQAKGLIILPCELILRNGDRLRECIQCYIDHWADDLGDDYRVFSQWFSQSCHVCTTLVDRIVPGFPKQGAENIQHALGYEDSLIVQAETFHLWVIEPAPGLSMNQLAREFPAISAGLNVEFTTDETPYHQRKVTLLNGPHTVLAPVAFLSGLDIVRDACRHEVVGQYVRHVMYEELLPTLDLSDNGLRRFADDVMERFCNPYIDHLLTSIMLNSFPKFLTRDLPALRRYVTRFEELPRGLVLGLAAIITYYRGGKRPDGKDIQPDDDPRILQLLNELWQTNNLQHVAQGVLGSSDIWGKGTNLILIPGLTDLLTDDLRQIQKQGMINTIASIL